MLGLRSRELKRLSDRSRFVISNASDRCVFPLGLLVAATCIGPSFIKDRLVVSSSLDGRQDPVRHPGRNITRKMRILPGVRVGLLGRPVTVSRSLGRNCVCDLLHAQTLPGAVLLWGRITGLDSCLLRFTRQRCFTNYFPEPAPLASCCTARCDILATLEVSCRAIVLALMSVIVRSTSRVRASFLAPLSTHLATVLLVGYCSSIYCPSTCTVMDSILSKGVFPTMTFRVLTYGVEIFLRSLDVSKLSLSVPTTRPLLGTGKLTCNLN